MKDKRLFTFIKVVFFVFLLFGILFLSYNLQADQSKENIEMFVNGERFDSLENYQQMQQLRIQQEEEKLHDDSHNEDLLEIKNMFDQTVRQSKDTENLQFDPNKLKTIFIKKGQQSRSSTIIKNSSRLATSHFYAYDRLSRAGFDHGVENVIESFKKREFQTRNLKAINTQQLEMELQKAFSDSNQPVLLMSDENSMRILQLKPDQKKEKVKE